jgi:hypothetical protein
MARSSYVKDRGYHVSSFSCLLTNEMGRQQNHKGKGPETACGECRQRRRDLTLPCPRLTTSSRLSDTGSEPLLCLTEIDPGQASTAWGQNNRISSLKPSPDLVKGAQASPASSEGQLEVVQRQSVAMHEVFTFIPAHQESSNRH